MCGKQLRTSTTVGGVRHSQRMCMAHTLKPPHGSHVKAGAARRQAGHSGGKGKGKLLQRRGPDAGGQKPRCLVPACHSPGRTEATGGHRPALRDVGAGAPRAATQLTHLLRPRRGALERAPLEGAAHPPARAHELASCTRGGHGRRPAGPAEGPRCWPQRPLPPTPARAHSPSVTSVISPNPSSVPPKVYGGRFSKWRLKVNLL